MPLTLAPSSGQSAMFSVMELRIIRSCIKQAITSMEAQFSSLDKESDGAVEIANDLPIYENILEKINSRHDV